MPNDTYYRNKILDIEDQLDAIDLPSEGSVCELVQTVKETTYPTKASSFFAIVPLEADGDESEGSQATYLADDTRIFHAVNLGSSIPPEGTRLIATCVGGRWCFRYDGGS